MFEPPTIAVHLGLDFVSLVRKKKPQCLGLSLQYAYASHLQPLLLVSQSHFCQAKGYHTNKRAKSGLMPACTPQEQEVWFNTFEYLQRSIVR